MPPLPDPQRLDLLWPQVHTLGVLAEQGSVTATAARLGLSKAAVSQRLTELERQAGVPLLRRTTRSVRLTEAGLQLVEATRGAYTQIARGFAEVRDLAEAPRGLLRLTVPVALGRQHIVPHLAGFLRAHPGLRIELDLSDRLVPLAREGYDLAIRHASAAPEDHVAWTLCPTRAVLVATPEHLQVRGEPRHPRELAAHEALGYWRPGEPAAWRFEPLAPAPGEPEPPVTVPLRGALAANNSELLRAAALEGLGLALLPDFSAQAEVRAGRLKPLLPDWREVSAFGAQILALRPAHVAPTRAVRALVAHLLEVLADGFPLTAGETGKKNPPT